MSSFKKHVKGGGNKIDSRVDSGGRNTSSGSVNESNSLISAVSLLGVKPWINCGLGLVSTGNKQFDEFIGGGLSLGTLTLFGLDHISNYGDTLISYNIAESLSIGHETLLICFYKTSFEKYKKSLPYNQHFKSTTTTMNKDDVNKNQAEFQHSNEVSESTVSENDNGDCTIVTNKVSDSLKLAASYKKYIDEKEKKAAQSQLLTSITTISNNNLTEDGVKDRVHSNIVNDSSAIEGSRRGMASVTNYCCSYDLSRSLQSEIFINNPLQSFIGEDLLNNSCSNNMMIDSSTSNMNVNMNTVHNDRGMSYNGNHNHPVSLLSQVLNAYIHKIHSFIETTIHERKTVGRVFLPDLTDLLLTLNSYSSSSFGSWGFNNNSHNSSNSSSSNNHNDNSSNSSSNSSNKSNTVSILLKFLLQLKQMIRNYRVSIILSVQPQSLHFSSSSSSSFSSYVLQQLIHLADNYFSMDSFISHASDAVPYEFKEFQGFFSIHKLSCLGTLSAYRPAGSNYKYGLKRDRRKLNIEPLHLPPEDNRATASSVASDAKQMSQLQQQSQQSQVQSQKSQSQIHHHHHHSDRGGQHEHPKTFGTLAYEKDEDEKESTTPATTTTTTTSFMNTNFTTLSNHADFGTAFTHTSSLTTGDSNTTTAAIASTSTDQATRVSLLAAKFARSAANVSKGSSISISHFNSNSAAAASTATYKNKNKSNTSSHSSGSGSSGSSHLCSSSSGLLSQDADKSLDF